MRIVLLVAVPLTVTLAAAGVPLVFSGCTGIAAKASPNRGDAGRDSDDSGAVIVVGADAGRDLLGDVLSAPIGTWVRLSPSDAGAVPGFGWEAGATWEPHSQKLVHHSGHDNIPQGFATFSFDPRTRRWAQVFPPTSPHGACLVDGALVADHNEGKVIRFPAAMLGHGYQYSRSERFKASWAWSYDVTTNDWVNWRPDVDAPFDQPYSALNPGTQNAATSFDARRGVVFHFAGLNSGGATNNLFAYDLGLNAFVRMPATAPPPPRDDGAFSHNPFTDTLVAYGGQYLEDSDTWVYSGEAKDWQRKHLSPSPDVLKSGSYSWIPKMACEDDSPFCLLVNWNPSTNLIDTWALDTETMTWTKLSSPVTPPPSLSRSRNLMYVSDLHAYLLELQRTGNGGNEVWAFRRSARPDDVVRPPSRAFIVLSEDAATLTWPHAVGAAKYRVWRSLSRSGLGATWSPLGETTAPTWHDPKPPALIDGAIYRVTSVAAGGTETPWGPLVRALPHPIGNPTVSSLTPTRVEVQWKAAEEEDVVGYNVYRWKAPITAITVGTPALYKDNDPDYGRLTPTSVKKFTEPRKLNASLLVDTVFVDDTVNLVGPTPESAGSAFAVFGYEVRAVNRWGLEGGRGARSLTLPAEPRNVMIQEEGTTAKLRWDPAREKNIRGYKIYTITDTILTIALVPGAGLLTATTYDVPDASPTKHYWVVTIDALGQEGQPSSAVVFGSIYRGFFEGPWHQ